MQPRPVCARYTCYLLFWTGRGGLWEPRLTVDIWRFTLFWTFTIFGTVFLAAGLWAWSVYFYKTRWAVLIPVIYVLSGEFIALVSGTIVGEDPPCCVCISGLFVVGVFGVLLVMALLFVLGFVVGVVLVVLCCVGVGDVVGLSWVVLTMRIGFTLAAVYNAGFKMSTWIPFFWGLIQILTVVSAGYSTVSSIL